MPVMNVTAMTSGAHTAVLFNFWFISFCCPSSFGCLCLVDRFISGVVSCVRSCWSVEMLYVDALHSGSFKQLKAVGEPVKLMEHDSSDAALYDQLGAFKAGRCRDVECGSFTRIVAPGYFVMALASACST